MKIGYARISTDHQNLDLQKDALEKLGCGLIYEEKASGKNIKCRPELQNCLKTLRQGDTLVVFKLDRLGRSVKEVLSFVDELKNKGVKLQSVQDNLDPNSPNGMAMLQLMAVFAELERGIIIERTKAGLAAARARGRVGGRKEVLNQKLKNEIRSLIAANNLTITRIAEIFNVSRGTVYNAIRNSK